MDIKEFEKSYLLLCFAKALSLVCVISSTIFALADIMTGKMTLFKLIVFNIGATLGLAMFFYVADIYIEPDEEEGE